MIIIRRSAGFATVVLSVLGLLLCLAGAAGVWWGKNRGDVIVAALFGTADDAFVFMDTRLERVHQAIESGRQWVNNLTTFAERLRTAEAEADFRAEVEPLLQALEEARDEFQSAEYWLDSINAIAGGVNRICESLAASKAGEESAALTASKLSEFSAGVVDALARLEVMRQELVNLREKKILARDFAAAIASRVTELDTRLASLSARIEAVDAQMISAQAASVDLERRVHWWIALAAVMLTLVLLWFGASQVSMMHHAWRFARGTAGGAVDVTTRAAAGGGRDPSAPG